VNNEYPFLLVEWPGAKLQLQSKPVGDSKYKEV